MDDDQLRGDLIVVAEQDDSTMIQYLHEKCDPAKREARYKEAMKIAIERHSNSVFMKLIELGCPHNSPFYSTKSDELHDHPIHVAVQHNNMLVLKKLVEMGVNINTVNGMDYTPLHLAAILRNFEIVKFLVEKGADMDLADTNGETALHVAIYKIEIPDARTLEICSFLLSAGADQHRCDRRGYTPLHFALENCSETALVELLLRNGANVNHRTRHELTPLHLAMKIQAFRQQYFDEEVLDIVRTLVRYGADVNAQTMAGCTPLLQAITSRDIDISRYNIVKYLIDMGADVNIAYSSGMTPIKAAAQANNIPYVRLLLEAGCTIRQESWLHNFPTPRNDLEPYDKDCLFELLDLSSRPRDLRDLCKNCIRKCLGQEINRKISFLPIPTELQRFIMVIGNDKDSRTQ